MIIHELSQWGPDAAAPPMSRADAETYCRKLATTHYENFPVVSWLLPRDLRQHFCNIYAFCRWADDLGDEIADAAESRRLLAWWRASLEQCYGGEATHPVFIALKPTVDEFQIPSEAFHDLISAFEQDQTVKEYATFNELREYCRRSADPVGRLVLHVCRQATAENLAWSDSICTGLQLANFWQDVARDANMGRIYLPQEDRERFEYSRTDFDARVTNPAFLSLMEFEVTRAREFLIQGLPLVTRLPGRLKIAIDLFARGGLKILQKIEQLDYHVWDRRPTVTKFDAVLLMMSSLTRRFVCLPSGGRQHPERSRIVNETNHRGAYAPRSEGKS